MFLQAESKTAEAAGPFTKNIASISTIERQTCGQLRFNVTRDEAYDEANDAARAGVIDLHTPGGGHQALGGVQPVHGPDQLEDVTTVFLPLLENMRVFVTVVRDLAEVCKGVCRSERDAELTELAGSSVR